MLVTTQVPDTAFALAVSRAMGTVVVTAHGHLGASEADVLQAVLVDLIEGQGNLRVVLDVRDVSGLGPSSLKVLVAATGVAARLGGQLTFADPSEAGTGALEAVGLGDAITLTRQCGQRALTPIPPGQGDGAARRAAMAEHPAGTGSQRK
jgi:anti-anti-sigma factor